MQEEIRAQKEREDEDYRRRRKESLEALKKLNIEEVLRQFPSKKKRSKTKEGNEYIPYQDC